MNRKVDRMINLSWICERAKDQIGCRLGSDLQAMAEILCRLDGFKATAILVFLSNCNNPYWCVIGFVALSPRQSLGNRLVGYSGSQLPMRSIPATWPIVGTWIKTLPIAGSSGVCRNLSR